MSGNRWRWGVGAAGAPGGGAGAQCAYPVLTAAPRRLSAPVSRYAVALRRTDGGWPLYSALPGPGAGG